MSKSLAPILLSVVFIIFSGRIAAQVSSVLDGAYVPETNITKRVMPYPYLREADVMYTQRIWQEIDLREKINHPFYYPVRPIANRKNLFDVIKDALLLDGSIVAYHPGPTNDDDEFTTPMSTEQLNSEIFNVTKTMENYDLVTGDRIQDTTVIIKLDSRDVTRYRIKEDWIWDRQRGERYVRIIGICPMQEKFDDFGVSKGYKPLFWLYYPECRYVFAHADAYNPLNDAQRRTFEELFQKRFFSSYIYKESNVYDRPIAAYASGLDALAESERIKEELFLLEHDLWHY